MSIEDQPQHIALPKLRGQPAYARPTRPVDVGPRPFDPDELPLAAEMTDDERAVLASLPDRAWKAGGVYLPEEATDPVRRTA